MQLKGASVIAFVGTANPEGAKIFYGEVLGFRLIADEPFALVFDAHGTMLRVTKLEQLTPPPYTVLGWAVADIIEVIDGLKRRGVAFEQFESLKQDWLGICTFPNGDQVAWFRDADGNLLSITQPGDAFTVQVTSTETVTKSADR